ncbi:hypothetical protein G6F42_023502 [Rhizopus arrhizus]|nr:hypothetical protein G6F42_023502 [Rhizopus arrhizus]
MQPSNCQPQHLDLFLTLIHRFRTTGSIAVFFKTGKELLMKFPNCKRWLQWWLYPGVSSMIFKKCKSLMKDEVTEHKTRTSNAIEAFHNALYRLMPKRQLVSTSLRLLLQVAQRDGVMLVGFFKNQKYATLYEVNDGRAPDNNTALFGVKKRKQEVVIIDDDEESKPNKAIKAKRHDVELNAALEEYLDEVDKTCLKTDDDVEKDEKLFLELLEADNIELT